MRELNQRFSDRMLVGPLPPLVVVIPVLGLMLLILSRSLGAGGGCKQFWLRWCRPWRCSSCSALPSETIAGHWIHTEPSVALVCDDQGTPLHLIGQVVDLSERRALERELRTAAVQDPLTGLINRRALMERLTEAQQRQDRHGGDIGLLFVDLDRFKTINDTYGHEVGDRLLIETGRQMLAATRQTDTVCRLGGDEFVVLCPSIDGRPGLQDLIGRLESMRAETMAGDAVVSVTQSIGSVLVEPGEELDAALRRADAGMYRNERHRNPGKHAMHQGRQVNQESRAR